MSKETLSFLKMHGAGNDFIVIDDRSQQFALAPPVIHKMAQRHTGIGCDGLILWRPPQQNESAGKMLFFNPDGSQAAFCGNGARCFARFLRESMTPVPSQLSFETDAGIIHASFPAHDEVIITVPVIEKKIWRLPLKLPNFSHPFYCDYIIAGVPHLILWVDDVERADFETLAPALRYAPELGPEGANVDFASWSGSHITLRTYERGVENETLACGSGVIACATSAMKNFNLPTPISVTVRSGYRLEVDFIQNTPDDPIPVKLKGKAEIVFHGEIALENITSL
ncbi:MAG: diaminopimelate epimerase [Lentisphaerae bacterium]|nr:MAG: diaminopimelate epimerase [Lentisphaerota bacterium]